MKIIENDSGDSLDMFCNLLKIVWNQAPFQRQSLENDALNLNRYLNFPDFLWYADELEGAGDSTVFETVPLENYFEYYGNSLELFGIWWKSFDIFWHSMETLWNP